MIRTIHASQRLDSRGHPTVQVRLTTSAGVFASLVPSGASKGAYEAHELRDQNPHEFHGLGVLRAVNNVNDVIAPALIARNFDCSTDLARIDAFLDSLDGSADKSRLGANAILGVSMAAARAGAAELGVPLYEFLRRQAEAIRPYILPVPFFNVVNGGVHAGNTLPFQEFMIAPVAAQTMQVAVQWGAEVYMELKKVVKERYGGQATGVGDEGGFAPPVSEAHEVLELLATAVNNCGHTGKFEFAIDAAATEFYRPEEGVYDLGFKSGRPRIVSKESLRELYKDLITKYPIRLIEDPFAQDDWDSWAQFHEETKIEIVGDDLLATNIERIKVAVEKKACNALLLKLNQIGTVTEAMNAAKSSFDNGWSVFVSHRSGETTDDFIADLAVALRTGHLKAGAPCRGERVVKYNRLLDIEEELHSQGGLTMTHYAGAKYRSMDIFGGL
ncbi:Enolase, C-terminal TIM barrel domain-containing protein [Sphaerosporella brunnea]|uniref:Enolase n=1 Tax=Sphaerosporella brunnea TaxID=1250544 RepID=A0A5J5EPB8_9PEZI|nr:Enolase, C-terminal TIM barrel domain-containing protein [Sphaerosporella brunnea]